jgi:hypothetical protein
MAATTVKVSTETRDRLKALGGATLEASIIEAMDALEATRFWDRAEAAAAWRRSLPPEEVARLDAIEAEADRAFDGLW